MNSQRVYGCDLLAITAAAASFMHRRVAIFTKILANKQWEKNTIQQVVVGICAVSEDKGRGGKTSNHSPAAVKAAYGATIIVTPCINRLSIWVLG